MDTQFLSGYHFFSTLDEVELQALLELTHTQYFEEGAFVLTEGQDNDALFLVQSGLLEVLKIHDDKEVLLGQVGPNGVFGEMSIFTPRPSSATVKAATKCCILTIKHLDLIAFINERPETGIKILSEMLKIVSERLQDINQKYGDCLFWLADTNKI